MPNESDFSLSAVQRKRSGPSLLPLEVDISAPRTTTSFERKSKPDLEHSPSSPRSFVLPFDPLLVVDALVRRLPWILALGVIAGLILAVVGWICFETGHIATAQLIKTEPLSPLRHSDSGEPYQPHELPIPTLTALMRSSVVLEKTSERLENKVTEDQIKAGLVVTPERNSNIVRVAYNSDHAAQQAVSILRAYIEEVLSLTRDIQKRDASEMAELLTNQTVRAENELLKVNEELLAYTRREELIDADKQIDAYLSELAGLSLKFESTCLDHETLDLRIQSIEKELSKMSPAAVKLQQAQEELAQLRLRYTDEHPVIMEAADRVVALQASLANDKPTLDAPPRPGESSIAESLYMDLVRYRSEKQVLGEQMQKIAAVRDTLNAKLELLPRKALEYARIKARQQDLETSRTLLVGRHREAIMHAENAQGSFRLLALDRPQDVLIQYPILELALAGFGGFAAVAGLASILWSLSAISDRRIRTVADLRRVSGLPILGALCEKGGSDPADWAFQTWTRLQTRLFKLPGTQATVCGLLTNETSAGGHLPALLATAAASRGQSVILISHGPALAVSAPLSEMIRTPEQVVAHLTRTPQQVLHLTLDEFWTWSPEQRQEWNRALDRWSQVRGTVILVQLSFPKEAETLLVAEQLPNLMWIDRGSTTPPDSLQNLLENYHAAGCRFVGAMLNEAHNFGFRPLNKLALTTLALLFSWVAAVPAQSDVLTLGPGDAVNISVPGRPEYARNQVAVGPDGCLTYLQAQNLRAAGLSIDQLRSKLMMELRRYHKNLIVVVTPMTFQSRKVYVLGKVVKTGAINLDRPMTVLETIAEAGGLETGLSQQNTVELADLGRSFLMRGKARVDVDMEALFYKGDMTQNVLVQPDDYLYFPSSSSNEIYVLGNVKRQGTQGLLANTSVHSSIAQAGGFTPRAYTQRVLVVRGSFDNPQTFTVDMAAMLEGREKGFRLEPKDIVFVADKPWARAEELLSFALNAFTQGAISGWVGVNTVPLIQEAILPSIQ